MSEGKKFDQGKIPYELIPPAALEEVAKVLAMGRDKYTAWNWSNGIAYTRLIGAILRHTFAYLGGQSKDEESGLSHIAHVAVNCLFILHFEKYKPELDDRKKHE